MRMVTLTCEAKVGDEKVQVTQDLLGVVADDAEALKHIKQGLRVRLMYKILEHWTPVVKMHETGRNPW